MTKAMTVVAPELKYVFDASKNNYMVGETETILGMLKKDRKEAREIYLAAKSFKVIYMI